MREVERPATFSGRRASQAAGELSAFIELLRQQRVRRYLEIGARHGDTFHAVMCALHPGAVGVAIDMPGGLWGVSLSKAALLRARADLDAKGIRTEVLFGDSHEPAIATAASQFGPFDAVFIDGDHRYEGVKADFELYGSAPLVAFHDIAGEGQRSKDGEPVEVPRLWAELRTRYETVELVDDGSTMGIGVAWTQRPLR